LNQRKETGLKGTKPPVERGGNPYPKSNASHAAVSEFSPENQPMTFVACVCTAVLCFLFGANTVAIKISLSGLGVFTTAGLRFAMASTVLYLWAIATGRPLAIKKEHRGLMLVVTLIFTVQLSLFYLGLSRSNASRATLLVNLQPFVVLFLAHFFIPGDRITLRKTIGIFMGFAGVAFVFMERQAGTGDFQGDLIILTATCIWGVNAVYVKRVIHNFRPFHLVFYPMMFSAPVFILEGMFWDGTMISNLNATVLAALFYQGLVTASFGFVAWTTLLKKYGAVSLHSFIFIMPISGVLFGGILLNEPVTHKIITALILIVSGIIVAHFKQHASVPLLPPGKN